jgi:gamma-glutamyltranspeptidase/glutathione hydrolase
LGKVNAIYCPRSTPSSPDTCQLRADYRGNGLVTTVNQK